MNESVACEVLPPPSKDNEMFRVKRNESSAEAILKMLEEGEKKTFLGENQEIVLILGNTGCGKTTIAQLLAGNENVMHSKKLENGDFIITDENNKIGQQTMVSETIYPELMIEKNYNTSIYDCPGFSDTRSTAHDISATYFIKKVVDHAERVKILFLVIYPSVRVGVDRQDFKRLLEHINGFVKNITKFSNSIALLVTKVSSYNDAGHFMEEEDIVRGIVQFLHEIRLSLQNQNGTTLSEQQKTFIENSLLFINIILKQENGRYVKIGISRSPNQCGRLSNIPLVMESKSSLETLYLRHISYSEKSENDFGYTLSHKSAYEINPIIQNINVKISNLTSEIASEERIKFVQESRKCDLVNCNIYYGKRHSILSKLLNKITNSSSVNAFFQKISSKLKSARRYEQQFVNQESYLQFFELITENKIERKVSLWKSSLERLLQVVHPPVLWYNFLSSLYEDLSSYEKQSNPIINTQAKAIANLALQNHLKSHNETFLSQVKGFSEIQTVFIDLSKYNELNAILSYTILKQTKFHCMDAEKEFVIEGNFVKVSDIIPKLRQIGCLSKKFIKIFSFDTIFIDVDLEFTGEEIQVTLVAPKWMVIGERQFNLNGSPGKSHSDSKSKNGVTFGDSGRNGSSGFPGGNAGSFFGVGEKFVNEELLLINVNGGNGGAGQNGGDGHRGQNGDDMIVENLPNPHSNHDNKVSESVNSSYANYGPLHTSSKIFSGEPGKKGGNGGHGGSPGEGGKSGQVKINALGPNIPNITIYQLRGKMGKPGKGGAAGEGGKHGNGLNVNLQYITLLGMEWKNPEIIDVNISAPAGVNGSNALISINLNDSNDFNNFTHCNDIIRYKIFYLLNLPSTNLNFRRMQSFYIKLESNEGIRDLYNVAAFGKELLHLESNFYSASNKTFYLESYESLLQRINYYKNHAFSESTLEQNKTFAVIKTATYSKICNAKQVFGIGLVTNVSSYFDSVIEKIEKLEFSSRLKIKNDLKGQYQKEYESKIEEGLNFIDTVVLPNINELQFNINSQVNELLNEVTELIDNERNRTGDLNRLKAELGETMLLRSVFGFVKAIGQIVSFIGPQGAIAGALISTGSFVTEPFIFDGDLNNEKPLTFPPVIQKLMINIDENIKLQKDSLISVLNEKIKAIENYTAKHKDKLGNFNEKVEKIKADIKFEEGNARFANSYSFLKLQEAQKSLNDICEQRIKELESRKKSVDERSQNELKDLQKANNVARTVEVAYDIYTKIKYDKNKVDKVAALLKESENKILLTELHKQKINKFLNPLVKKFSTDIIGLTESLGKSSSYSKLSGNRWKLQILLKDFKINIANFTDGFPVQEKFMQCLESLNESINVLMEIFVRILNYQEQKMLGDYIADMNSVDVATMNIKDPNLVVLLNDLSWTIQSNIFLGEYERTLSVFKQWVFPFAHLYLDEFSIAINSTNRNGIEMIKYEFSGAIRKLKDKLNGYKNQVVSGQDKYLRTSFFSSDTRSSKPFFVWKHNEWQETLRNLLTGQPVRMYADVTKSVKNAVKFTKIEIKFITTNISVQNDIDNKLALFSVSLTHNGSSYYKTDKKFYRISSEALTIKYSFEKKNENYVSFNRVYEKLSAGDYMLSPYTLWGIQLHKESDEADFKDLEIYSGIVSLELFGTGLYVDDSADFSQLHIDDYYLAN